MQRACLGKAIGAQTESLGCCGWWNKEGRLGLTIPTVSEVSPLCICLPNPQAFSEMTLHIIVALLIIAALHIIRPSVQC